MPVEWLDYDSGSSEWTDLVRYPTRAIGATEWALLPDLSTDGEREVKALRWLRKLQSMSPPSRRCPRIFIAYLEEDRLTALKMARIVSECGFHFWLDVLDPHVARFSSLGAGIEAMVTTSAVIEMALLNCTHIISIGNGSPWVNYAFGRVRSRAAYLWQTGTWLAAGVGADALQLGVQTRTKQGVLDWLNSEFAMTLGCPRRLPVEWSTHPGISSELP